MIELTEQQRVALDGSQGTPIVETNSPYMLIRRDVYERLRGFVDADDARLMEPMLAVTDLEDWEDLAYYEREG